MNPFTDLKAENWSPEKTVARFVPNRVWDKVRIPNTQILIGGWGTGKSALLKRMAWEAMEIERSYLPHSEFIGIYINLFRLAYLNTVLEFTQGTEVPAQTALNNAAINFASHVGGLHLAVILCKTAMEVTKAGRYQWKEFEEPLLRSLKACFRNCYLATNVSDAIQIIGDQLDDVRGKITGPAVFSLPNSITGDNIVNISHVATILTEAIRDAVAKTSIPVCFLLDQFDCLEPVIQDAFAPMLHRENNFYTIIAIRPFTFDPRGTYLTPTDDYSSTCIEYFQSEQSEYKEFVEKLGDKLLHSHDMRVVGGFRSLLDAATEFESPRERCSYFGFDCLCDLASGSLRKFLDICSECVTFAETTGEQWVQQGFSAQTQHQAVKNIAERERERISDVPGLREGKLWELAKYLAHNIEQLKEKEPSGISTPLSISGIPNGRIENNRDLSLLLRKAFKHGAIQQIFPGEVPTVLPRSFRLSGLFAPLFELSPQDGDVINVEFESLCKVAKPAFPPPKKLIKPIRPPGPLKSVFLSTSFRSVAELETNREIIRQGFDKFDIDVKEGFSLGPGQFTEIVDQMRGTQATLIELTQTRANVVLELGASLAMGHLPIPLLNPDAKATIPELASEDIQFLRDWGYVPYSFSSEKMEKTISAIIDYWNRTTEETYRWKVFVESKFGRKPLRVKKPRSKTCYFHYPRSLSNTYENMKNELEAKAQGLGFDISFPNDAPIPIRRDPVAEIVYLASRSSHVIADTWSGKEMPDLLSCLLLGFTYGSSEKPIKVVYALEKGDMRCTEMSLWPKNLFLPWTNKESLLEVLERVLCGPTRTISKQQELFK